MWTKVWVGKGEPDAQRRACYDCVHCQAAVHWWCMSEQAVNAYGTNLPGRIDCEFWDPTPRAPEKTWWERLLSLPFGPYDGLFNRVIEIGEDD